jgi:hypothetical protein
VIKRLASLLLGAALLGAPATAQTAPVAPTIEANPALWVVKDKDTTIYLFGTIHVLKPGLSWFDDAVKAAFDKSDGLVLETVLPDAATMQGLVIKLGFNKDAKTLPEKLPDADRAPFAQALTEFGAPPGALDHADPWLAATELSILPVTKLGYDPANGPEAVLTAAAKAAGKPVTGLETPEQQLGYLANLSEPAQLAFLDSAIKELPKVGDEANSMVTDWAKGDPEALAKLLNDDLTDEAELKKTLLIDRNARWADWVVNRLKTPGTVFVAVGAGHLAGADSVQDDLARMHVKVTRISY